MPSSDIETRQSEKTKKRLSGIAVSYLNQNLLAETLTYVRGRRYVTCSVMSDAYDTKSKSSSSGGK